MSLILDGSLGTTFNDGSNQSAAASPFVLKNRLINSDMRIDQRNAGASLSNANTSIYGLDRWLIYGTLATKFTVQQNAGSVTPPVGFTNYLGITSSAATSVGTGDIFIFAQLIEGLNIADLAWGTANARTVTLSFWVRSSLTGTFGGSLRNSAFNRSYPFSYTISSANTWEQKTITIAGDTSGTWLTTNGIGIMLSFSLGTGATFSGTAGSWSSSNFLSATGATSVVGTNGATFYITGVQLEQNTSATPFERRLYGQELALCQRYYYRLKLDAVGNTYGLGQVYSANNAVCFTPFPVTMRTAPAALEQSGTASNYRMWKANSTVVACTSVPTLDGATSNSFGGTDFTSTSLVGTAGQSSNCSQNNTNGYLGWSAEL
jgi:hypothetical protein